MFCTFYSFFGHVFHFAILDLAIGAPYEGTNGDGAVYIYNGGQNGLRGNIAQKIFASQMPSIGKGFGISIAGAVDVDGNGYPGESSVKNLDIFYILKTF